MITAEAQPLDQSHLRLVFTGPSGFKKEPVTVADKGEAIRVVYFYNRQYICDTLRGWLFQRRNVFNHVDDLSRVTMVDQLVNSINRYSQVSLRQLCQFVVQQEQNIIYLAPGVTSRYYKKYYQVILPLIADCHEVKGDEPKC
jgi:hypothetical protein